MDRPLNGARVFNEKLGEGIVLSSIPCHGNTSSFLLEIQFKDLVASLYDDEVSMVYDA